MATDVRARPRDPSLPVQEAPKEGVLLVQSAQGLQRVRWTQGDAASVRLAMQTFTDLRRCGYRAYRLAAGEKVHEELVHFDPAEREVVMIMPLCGG